jgi:YVTN family beta-propeller protein
LRLAAERGRALAEKPLKAGRAWDNSAAPVHLEFRILGPLDVVRDGSPIPLGGAKQRAVLAVLVLHAGEIVPLERLIDDVWGDDPPASVENALQVYVSRLRRAVAGDGSDGAVVRERHGYALRVEPTQIDALRFERLAQDGRAALEAGDPARAATDLRAALSLWRGPALADLAQEPFAAAASHRLDDLRLSALEDRLEADLALGRHADVLGELEAFVAEHPYRERFRSQLMRALYASGRQADALAAFEAARRSLDELGLEPGEPLKELQRQILRHDPGLEAPRGRYGPLGGGRRRPVVALAVAVMVAALAAVALALSLDRGESSTTRALTRVPRNSVAVIDPDTNKIVDAIPVGSRPSGIAVGEGDLWVGAFEDDSVLRIDPRSRRVVRAIPIGAPPNRIVVAAGAAWATSADGGTVTRIDARTSFVTKQMKTRQRRFADPAFASIARLQTHEQVPLGVTAGSGSIWVAQGFSVVSRLDPRTGRVLAQIDVAERPNDVAATDDSVWATTEGSGEVVAIDARRNAVARRVKIGGDLEYLGGIAAGFGAVWVSAYDNFRDVAQVWRVDPASGRATDSVRVKGRKRLDWPTAQRLGHIRVAAGEGAVWVASALRGTVSRIDPETLAVTATIALPGAVDVAVGEGAVWVTVTDKRSTRR